MKLLLPWYDLRLTQGVLDAAKHCEVVAIANVWSGPGAKRDEHWATNIDRVLKAGVTVLGYIDAVRWPDDGPRPVKRRRNATRSEIVEAEARWAEWYGIIHIFSDDSSGSTVQKDMTLDVWNWGCEPPLRLVQRLNTMWHVVHEGHEYLKSAPSRLPPHRQAIMALNERDFAPALALAAARGVELVFISNRRDKTPSGKDDWTTYDEHPSYLIKLAKAIGGIDKAKQSS